MNKNNAHGAAAAWSLFGSAALCAAGGWFLGGYRQLWPEMKLLLTGGVRAIEKAPGASLLEFIPLMLALIPVMLIASWLSIMLVEAILGSPRHEFRVSYRKAPEGELEIFKLFFQIITFEEVLARLIFLGWLVKIPGLNGLAAFYVLFFTGNLIWALLHLYNYTEFNRHWFRVLPQFVGGIFLTYVYVKHGFLAVLLTHFGYDAVLFAAERIQRVGKVDLAIIAVSGLGAVISFGSMRQPLGAIVPWFAISPTFELPGWGFWDYLKVLLFAEFAAEFIFGLLLYDRSQIGGSQASGGLAVAGGLGLLVFALPAAIVFVLQACFMFWLLGYVISDVSYRIVLISILWCFERKAPSISAMARQFWCSLPYLFILVCILQALGFWDGVGLVTLMFLFTLPLVILHLLDD